MERFTPQEFQQYFTRSFLLGDDRIARCVGDYLGDNRFALLRRGEPAKSFTLNELKWSNVAFPQLGYRNLNQTGKKLYHVKRKVGRITKKGVCDETILIETERNTANFMQYVGVSVDPYYADGRLSQDFVDQLYDPWFPKFKEAKKKILEQADCVSFALHNDVAIVPGLKEKSQLMLLWKGHLAAISKDGEDWKYFAKDHEDALKRCIKELN